MASGWIESQLIDLKSPTEVTVHSIGAGGISEAIQLTANVWQKHLLRGPWKDPFLRIWDTFTRAEAKRDEILSEITISDSQFHQGCLNFIYDLRNIGDNKGSRARLEGNGHRFTLEFHISVSRRETKFSNYRTTAGHSSLLYKLWRKSEWEPQFVLLTI